MLRWVPDMWPVAGTMSRNQLVRPSQSYGDWYVTDAFPYAPGQVMLLVGRTPSPRPAPALTPVRVTPTPSTG